MRKLVAIFLLPVAVVILATSCNTTTNTDNNQSEQISDTIGKKAELSKAEQNKLNAFLTNFSEVHLYEFSKDNLPDSVLIEFGVYYNYRNHFRAFKQLQDGLEASISETMVTDTAFKFFDVRIKNQQSVYGIEYKDGNYIIGNSDGEAFRFSQVKELFDAGNELLSATFEIYSCSPGFTGDINVDPETWESNPEEEEIPQSEGLMKALVRKATVNGETKYTLVEYLK